LFQKEGPKNGGAATGTCGGSAPGAESLAWLSPWPAANPEKGLGIKDGLCESHKQ